MIRSETDPMIGHVQVLVEPGMTRLRQDVLKLKSPQRRLHTGEGREVEVCYRVAGTGDGALVDLIRLHLRSGPSSPAAAPSYWHPEEPEGMRHAGASGSPVWDAASGMIVALHAATEPAFKGLLHLNYDYSDVCLKNLFFAEADVLNQPQMQSLMFEASRDADAGMVVAKPEAMRLPFLEEYLSRWLDVWTEPNAEASTDTHPPYLALRQRLSDEKTGRLDGSKIAKLFGLTTPEMGKLCGVSKQSFQQNPTSKGMQDKLEPLVKAARGVLWCGGDEARFKTWLNASNADFPEVEGRQLTPLDLIRMGHAQVVADKLQNLLTGHPS